MSEVLCEDCAKFCACDEVTRLRADNERLRADRDRLRVALREAARRLIANGDGFGASEAINAAIAGEQEKTG